ncbi:MAG: hypothetical protein P4L64_08120 [Caulobacteraceae bacterium]|nr:hypothetical protein [Caulobacteraceae bacterium]
MLVKSAFGYVPRSAEDLDFVLGRAYGRPVSSADLMDRLTVIARALDQGDLTRAMIATQQMRLPPLNEAGALRAVEAEAVVKAAADDPKHPGWPRGSGGGRGGQFRPVEAAMTAATVADVGLQVEKRLRKRILRQVLKAGVRLALKPGRLARLGLEAASNLIPGADLIGDALLVKDVAEAVGEGGELYREAKAALDFARLGPRSLKDLQMVGERTRFSSFDAFKKAGFASGDLEKYFGPAGDGWEYHHIVEQGANGAKIAPEVLNSPSNIIRIPKLLHEEVSAEFAKMTYRGGRKMSVRAYHAGKSFEEQYQLGIDVLRSVGVIK